MTEKLLLTDFAHRRGMRVFWIEHDSIGHWLTMNPWFPRLRRLASHATTITVSRLSRNLYLRLGWTSERVMVIPNGIDVARYMHRKIPSYRTTAPLHIGCLSRLSHEKGVDLLIEAVSGLSDMRLTIVGRGKKEKELRGQAEWMRLTGKQVNILSWIEDLTSFYHSLDVFVLPSRTHDPFGLVAAEAMACGVPTVVTKAAGIAGELEHGKDALIVEAGSAASIRNALRTLQQNPGLCRKLSENGRKAAEEKFSLERMVTDYERVIVT